MWREACLVAGKDLRIERRSKVTTGQVLPFALVMLLLFGFALDSERGLLQRAAPGLFWIAVLLSTLLAIQRSFAIESADSARDGLRLSGLDPAGIFLGKASSVVIQLAVLEALLVVGVYIFYDLKVSDAGLLLATCLLATVGLAAIGTLYAAMSAGLRARETLLPLLFLPAVAPILLAATRASEAAAGLAIPGEGWRWVSILAVFAVIYLAVGTVAFGALLEDS